MSKKIYVFDLDETLFSSGDYFYFDQQKYVKLHPHVLKSFLTPTERNYYIDTHEELKKQPENQSYEKLIQLDEAFKDVYHQKFYAIHKDAMRSIMQAILANGDEIAFITAGKFSKMSIKNFFKDVYQIDLGDDFKFFNEQKNKSEKLAELIKYVESPKDIIFTDNSPTHIFKEAEPLGVTAVYADTNPHDQTGNKKYLYKLHEQLKLRTNEVQNTLLIEKILDYAKNKASGYVGYGGDTYKFNGKEYYYVPTSVIETINAIIPYIHLDVSIIEEKLNTKFKEFDGKSIGWGSYLSGGRHPDIEALYQSPEKIINQFKIAIQPQFNQPNINVDQIDLAKVEEMPKIKLNSPLSSEGNFVFYAIDDYTPENKAIVPSTIE
ncbi:hypothetical protein L3V83_08070 [Thiotrichales bacterium 19X7-9]|nr:hypothetical protein [Thiotrichales bacterium 19X7-9]